MTPPLETIEKLLSDAGIVSTGADSLTCTDIQYEGSDPLADFLSLFACPRGVLLLYSGAAP